MANILFVCSEGLIRSPTAAKMIGERYSISTLYCGFSGEHSLKLDKQLLDWAEHVVVFGQTNRSKIRRRFKGHSHKMTCWNIPDEYYPMQSELQELISACWENRTQLSNPQI